MIRLGVFFTVLAISSLLLVAVRDLPRDVDAFTADQQQRRKVLSLLPAGDAIEVKLAHAQKAERYQVGLFGNSRALMVDSASLGRPESFFNFAITGVTFATILAMLERLEAMGKLPAVALISFDHPLIAHPPYPAPDTSLLRRWRRYLLDFAWAVRSDDVDWRTIQANLAEQAGAEWSRLRGIFSFEQLRLVMAYRFPTRIPVIEVAPYRQDGSRPEQLPEGGSRTDMALRASPYLMALELHMQHLAQIAERNRMRVVLYRSPVHPAVLASAPANAAAQALEMQFRTACQRLVLDCRGVPDMGNPAEPPYWPDGNHAPAARLGAYLGGVIGEQRTVNVGARQ
jgi:hypothetical protein